MIKTLFASLCVVACCMGNEYPAKAYDDSWDAQQLRQEIKEVQRQHDNQLMELRREIRAERYRNNSL